jgi:hypothetical protein
MPLANLLAKLYLSLDDWLDTAIAPSYTNVGYRIRSALMWDRTDLDVDLSSKVIAITGANSGIGFAAAQQSMCWRATSNAARTPANA